MFVLFTPPQCSRRVAAAYNLLFREGLHCLILRLKGASREQYEEVILEIASEYRHRILIDDHFELLHTTQVGGAYLNPSKWNRYKEVRKYTSRIATSAHSIDQLFEIPFSPSFAMLSPVYDSISKKGYRATISLEECKEELPKLHFPVLALGGITPERYREVLHYGFAGGATLGYLYEEGTDMLSAFLRFPLPEVLSVAGHDPSSGAGITADALTIQYAGGYPLTVPTALTIQNEATFEESIPLSLGHVERMLRTLRLTHPLQVAKIGLTSSLAEVLSVARLLRELGTQFIIWDPILKPTKGDLPLWQNDLAQLQQIASCIDLITPNRREAEEIWGAIECGQLLDFARKYSTAILVTGYEKEAKIVEDTLYTSKGEVLRFAESATHFEKHGTGCALTSFIATRIAQGYSLEEACREGQRFVARLRTSSPTLFPDRRLQEGDSKRIALQQVALQYITNGSSSKEILEKAKQYLEAGGRWIQLRMKKATHEERVATARELKALVDTYPNAVLIVDDDVEAVLESGADGVHLGLDDCSIVAARQRLGWDRIIGGTCNTLEDIRRRALEGADYIGVGPFRSTKTKEKLSPLLGKEGMAHLVSCHKELAFPLPFVAIGGITEDDFATLADIGVEGVALSGIIENSKNIPATVQRLLCELDSVWQKSEK